MQLHPLYIISTGKLFNKMSDLAKTLQEELKRQAIEKLKRQQLIDCFTAENVNSKASKKQTEFLKAISSPAVKYRVFEGGNQSSKTSSCTRDFTWFIQEIHPYWTRPNNKFCHVCNSKNFYTKLKFDDIETITEYENLDRNKLTGAESYHCRDCGNYWKDWGDIPLGSIVVGQDSRNIEENLWPRIRSLLLEGNDTTVWKEKRNGGSLQSVRNLKTGSRIIFLTHGYSAEDARAAIQGYTLHYVWADELPSLEVMEELQRRVDRFYGYFLASYTPKKVARATKRFVEGLVKAGVAIFFKFSKYDNPQFAADQELEKKKLTGLSATKRRTIEYGDWPEDETTVYGFDYDTMTVESLPEGYETSWPHMEIVDPAMVNKMGYLLVTYDERSGIWYSVEAEYIEHEWAPSKLVQEVDKLSQDYNVQWWASDTENFFIREARERYPHKYYQIPFKKTSRKKELIKNLQQALTDGNFKILRKHTNLIDEIEECRYNDTGERIIAATKYHLLDCSQYFIDIRPTVFIRKEEKNFKRQCIEATIESKKKAEDQPKVEYRLAPSTKKLFSRRRGRR